ncbi:MAG: serine acetyltransferase [Spirochaetaceae bacterium]|jgi:serine O-acetyltransferase|nr:serine acetyltransferase [Spirochaetaceae bacterium]
MHRLNRSIETLVDSYRIQGLVNPAGGDSLPSQSAIRTILLGLNELLFPGFRENSVLDHDNLQLITAERVNRLARELVREVEKSIGFSMRQGGLSCGGKTCHAAAELLVEEFFETLPEIRTTLSLDMEAAFRGDPAAKSAEEVILSYPGFEAVVFHRLAHFFWKREVPLIPRMMSEFCHSRTGIDIHPGADIGASFFIDHGTGMVIGETTVIGQNVKLYQGVTLGALSVRKEQADRKRHPTIQDDVTIYAGATILGGETVIGCGSTIGGNVWITESVPPNTTVYVRAGDQVVHIRRQEKPQRPRGSVSQAGKRRL